MSHKPNTKVVEKTVEVQELDIPEEELEEYREAFALFDKDGDGEISSKEFIKVLKNLGQNVSADEAAQIMAELDQDGSGMIDFTEFVSYMRKTKIQEVIEDEDPVIKAFMTFDKANNDNITNHEFRYILTQLGDRFTQEEADEIFKEANLDNNGLNWYRKFVEEWRNK